MARNSNGIESVQFQGRELPVKRAHRDHTERTQDAAPQKLEMNLSCDADPRFAIRPEAHSLFTRTLTCDQVVEFPTMASGEPSPREVRRSAGGFAAIVTPFLVALAVGAYVGLKHFLESITHTIQFVKSFGLDTTIMLFKNGVPIIDPATLLALGAALAALLIIWWIIRGLSKHIYYGMPLHFDRY